MPKPDAILAQELRVAAGKTHILQPLLRRAADRIDELAAERTATGGEEPRPSIWDEPHVDTYTDSGTDPPAVPAPDKAQEEVAAAHEVQRIREAVMNGDTDWQTECTAAIEHNHALRRELSAAHASGREEGERAALAKELPAFRRALEGAAILLNINEGDKQPYASGYDSVHDAYNEVWHAWKMAERLCAALPVPSPAQERGHVGLWPWDHPQ